MINDEYIEDWKWWKEKVHDYEDMDALSDKEFRRVVNCFMQFILNYTQPERSKREDSDDEIIRKVLFSLAKMPHRYKTK